MMKVFLEIILIELNVPPFKGCKLKSCPYDALLDFFFLWVTQLELCLFLTSLPRNLYAESLTISTVIGLGF